MTDQTQETQIPGYFDTYLNTIRHLIPDEISEGLEGNLKEKFDAALDEKPEFQIADKFAEHYSLVKDMISLL